MNDHMQTCVWLTAIIIAEKPEHPLVENEYLDVRKTVGDAPNRVSAWRYMLEPRWRVFIQRIGSSCSHCILICRAMDTTVNRRNYCEST